MMIWAWFWMLAVMPVWLIAGNILGTIRGRFAPPARPVYYDRPVAALTERVTQPAPATPPVIVNVYTAAPSIPGWAPRPAFVEGQVVTPMLSVGEESA